MDDLFGPIVLRAMEFLLFAFSLLTIHSTFRSDRGVDGGVGRCGNTLGLFNADVVLAIGVFGVVPAEASLLSSASFF